MTGHLCPKVTENFGKYFCVAKSVCIGKYFYIKEISKLYYKSIKILLRTKYLWNTFKMEKQTTAVLAVTFKHQSYDVPQEREF